MLGTNHPTQYDPNLTPITCWIGPPEEWPWEVREDIGLALFAARAWGRDILLVSHENEAGFTIRWADSRGQWAGLWIPSERRIALDYEMADGRTERRRSVLHEIGHMLGCGHVKDPRAVMFDRLGSGGDPTAYPTDAHLDETQGHTIPNDLATDFVTQADLDEYNRVVRAAR